MDFYLFIFYVFSGLTVLSALVIVFTRNVLYAAFSLILTFLSVAGIYVLAGADFVAIAQILIYIGGILVLIIFGIMLTNRISGQEIITTMHNRFLGIVIGLILFSILVYYILQTDFMALSWIKSANATGAVVKDSTIEQIGVGLMSIYLFPFELVAILLLIALIGAALIAKGQLKRKVHREEKSIREKQF